MVLNGVLCKLQISSDEWSPCERRKEIENSNLLDIVFCISLEGVHVVSEVDNSIVFESLYANIREILWDHSDKAIKFTLENGETSSRFVFVSLKEIETQILAALKNPELSKIPEHAYMGVLIGKNLPSPIQQRRVEFDTQSAPTLQLPSYKRRELLHLERPPKNVILREKMALEFIRRGFLNFACSSNGDVRSLKLDLHYIYVFPSPECHDRSACLFSYPYDHIENCESFGPRLELRFRRVTTTKQPTLLVFQTPEAQIIRDAVWYFKTGNYMDITMSRLVAKEPIKPRRHTTLAKFQDDGAIRRHIESKCIVIGCKQAHEFHIGAGMGGFCKEHQHLVALPQTSSRRVLSGAGGGFFTRDKAIPATSYLFHSKHYPRMLKYQGQLLKKGGKYQLTTGWHSKYLALFETPVGSFLCYYDKLANCPGINEKPKERRVIDLSSVICIRPESNVTTNLPSGAYAFDIVTLYRSFTFASLDLEEYEIWLQVIAEETEKHMTISPDRRVRYPIKVIDDPCHQITKKDTQIFLEICSNGVSIGVVSDDENDALDCDAGNSNLNDGGNFCGNKCEVELYSWYFTDIRKWSSEVTRQNERCCLLSCFVSSSDSSGRYYDFLLQTDEAATICHAIEFYVGKCMAKLDALVQTRVVDPRNLRINSHASSTLSTSGTLDPSIEVVQRAATTIHSAHDIQPFVDLKGFLNKADGTLVGKEKSINDDTSSIRIPQPATLSLAPLSRKTDPKDEVLSPVPDALSVMNKKSTETTDLNAILDTIRTNFKASTPIPALTLEPANPQSRKERVPSSPKSTISLMSENIIEIVKTPELAKSLQKALSSSKAVSPRALLMCDHPTYESDSSLPSYIKRDSVDIEQSEDCEVLKSQIYMAFSN
jgi:hypothetical protein